MTTWSVLGGDVRARLSELAAGSVQTCVTSPPYWGLRDYGIEATVWGGEAGCAHVWGDTISVNATNHTDKRRWNHTRNGRDEEQPVEKRVAWLRTVVDQGNFCQGCGAWRGALGLEPTPDLFVEHLVGVFGEVWRVLRDDGTLWLNLGDSYAGSWGNQGRTESRGTQRPINGGMLTPVHDGRYPSKVSNTGTVPSGLKPKDLVGIPWRVAFALQAAGWYLRSDIIWAKPNPMPESVQDRPTRSHEYLFLLSKQARYYYDAAAIAEPAVMKPQARLTGRDFVNGKDAERAVHRRPDYRLRDTAEQENPERNKRSVWNVATQPYPDAHFATFPEALIEPCILAGSRIGDTVLDPFAGSGTTGVVAIRHQRDFLGIELNPNYLELARTRIGNEAPLFSTEARCPTTRVSVSDVRDADQPTMFSCV